LPKKPLIRKRNLEKLKQIKEKDAEIKRNEKEFVELFSKNPKKFKEKLEEIKDSFTSKVVILGKVLEGIEYIDKSKMDQLKEMGFTQKELDTAILYYHYEKFKGKVDINN
jgi:hypothetical protein